jgi:hypothetical protein
VARGPTSSAIGGLELDRLGPYHRDGLARTDGNIGGTTPYHQHTQGLWSNKPDVSEPPDQDAREADESYDGAEAERAAIDLARPRCVEPAYLPLSIAWQDTIAIGLSNVARVLILINAEGLSDATVPCPCEGDTSGG